MKCLTKGIHHFAIWAENMEAFDKAVSFYRDLLGMPVVREWPKPDGGCGMMLDTGAGMVEIIMNASAPVPRGALRHLALLTDSADECIEKVRAAGYKITIETFDFDIPSTPAYPIRIGFCEGPLGEEIEFLQER